MCRIYLGAEGFKICFGSTLSTIIPHLLLTTYSIPMGLLFIPTDYFLAVSLVIDSRLVRELSFESMLTILLGSDSSRVYRDSHAIGTRPSRTLLFKRVILDLPCYSYIHVALTAMCLL